MSIVYRFLSKNTIFLLVFILINIIFIDISWADVPANVLNRTADDFKVAMASWDQSVRNAATYLFYTLLTIAMVWRFSMMAIKGGQLNDIFIDLIRTIMIAGLFTWLVQGVEYAKVFRAIFQGMGQLAMQASGESALPTPSGMLTVGTTAAGKILDTIGWTNALSVESILKLGVAGAILVLYCLIAINVLLAFIAFYFMTYAGVFLLAFWSTDWTRDTAIMYLKALLARSIEFYGIILLAAASSDIFQNCLNDFVSSSGADTWLPLATLFTAAVVTYLLITKLPAMLAQCVAPIQSAGVSASGFAAVTGLSAAAGMMMGAAKTFSKSVGSGAAAGAANTARATGRAAMSGTFGVGVQTVANQAYGMGQGIAHGMTAVGEFFGKNPGGATRASLRRGFESRGIDSANAKNLAADAHDRMVRSGMTKDEAMDYSYNSFAGRSSGRESSENSISGSSSTSGSNGSDGNDGGSGGNAFTDSEGFNSANAQNGSVSSSAFSHQSGVNGVERTQNAKQQSGANSGFTGSSFNNGGYSSSSIGGGAFANSNGFNSTGAQSSTGGAFSNQSGVNGVERTQNARQQGVANSGFTGSSFNNGGYSSSSFGSGAFANGGGFNSANSQSTSGGTFNNQSSVNGVERTQNARQQSGANSGFTGSAFSSSPSASFGGSGFARGNSGTNRMGSSHIPGGLSSGLEQTSSGAMSSRGNAHNVDPYDPNSSDFQRTMMNRADVDLNGSGPGNNQGDPVSQSYWSSNA